MINTCSLKKVFFFVCLYINVMAGNRQRLLNRSGKNYNVASPIKSVNHCANDGLNEARLVFKKPEDKDCTGGMSNVIDRIKAKKYTGTEYVHSQNILLKKLEDFKANNVIDAISNLNINIKENYNNLYDIKNPEYNYDKMKKKIDDMKKIYADTVKKAEKIKSLMKKKGETISADFFSNYLIKNLNYLGISHKISFLTTINETLNAILNCEENIKKNNDELKDIERKCKDLVNANGAHDSVSLLSENNNILTNFKKSIDNSVKDRTDLEKINKFFTSSIQNIDFSSFKNSPIIAPERPVLDINYKINNLLSIVESKNCDLIMDIQTLFNNINKIIKEKKYAEKTKKLVDGLNELLAKFDNGEKVNIKKIEEKVEGANKEAENLGIKIPEEIANDLNEIKNKIEDIKEEEEKKKKEEEKKKKLEEEEKKKKEEEEKKKKEEEEKKKLEDEEKKRKKREKEFKKSEKTFSDGVNKFLGSINKNNKRLNVEIKKITDVIEEINKVNDLNEKIEITVRQKKFGIVRKIKKQVTKKENILSKIKKINANVLSKANELKNEFEKYIEGNKKLLKGNNDFKINAGIIKAIENINKNNEENLRLIESKLKSVDDFIKSLKNEGSEIDKNNTDNIGAFTSDTNKSLTVFKASEDNLSKQVGELKENINKNIKETFERLLKNQEEDGNGIDNIINNYKENEKDKNDLTKAKSDNRSLSGEYKKIKEKYNAVNSSNNDAKNQLELFNGKIELLIILKNQLLDNKGVNDVDDKILITDTKEIDDVKKKMKNLDTSNSKTSSELSNLSKIGEKGFIVFKDDSLAEKLKKYKEIESALTKDTQDILLKGIRLSKEKANSNIQKLKNKIAELEELVKGYKDTATDIHKIWAFKSSWIKLPIQKDTAVIKESAVISSFKKLWDVENQITIIKSDIDKIIKEIDKILPHKSRVEDKEIKGILEQYLEQKDRYKSINDEEKKVDKKALDDVFKNNLKLAQKNIVRIFGKIVNDDRFKETKALYSDKNEYKKLKDGVENISKHNINTEKDIEDVLTLIEDIEKKIEKYNKCCKYINDVFYDKTNGMSPYQYLKIVHGNNFTTFGYNSLSTIIDSNLLTYPNKCKTYKNEMRKISTVIKMIDNVFSTVIRANKSNNENGIKSMAIKLINKINEIFAKKLKDEIANKNKITKEMVKFTNDEYEGKVKYEFDRVNCDNNNLLIMGWENNEEFKEVKSYSEGIKNNKNKESINKINEYSKKYEELIKKIINFDLDGKYIKQDIYDGTKIETEKISKLIYSGDPAKVATSNNENGNNDDNKSNLKECKKIIGDNEKFLDKAVKNLQDQIKALKETRERYKKIKETLEKFIVYLNGSDEKPPYHDDMVKKAYNQAEALSNEFKKLIPDNNKLQVFNFKENIGGNKSFINKELRALYEKILFLELKTVYDFLLKKYEYFKKFNEEGNIGGANYYKQYINEDGKIMNNVYNFIKLSKLTLEVKECCKSLIETLVKLYGNLENANDNPPVLYTSTKDIIGEINAFNSVAEGELMNIVGECFGKYYEKLINGAYGQKDKEIMNEVFNNINELITTKNLNSKLLDSFSKMFFKTFDKDNLRAIRYILDLIGEIKLKTFRETVKKEEEEMKLKGIDEKLKEKKEKSRERIEKEYLNYSNKMINDAIKSCFSACIDNDNLTFGKALKNYEVLCFYKIKIEEIKEYILNENCDLCKTLIEYHKYLKLFKDIIIDGNGKALKDNLDVIIRYVNDNKGNYQDNLLISTLKLVYVHMKYFNEKPHPIGYYCDILNKYDAYMTDTIMKYDKFFADFNNSEEDRNIKDVTNLNADITSYQEFINVVANERDNNMIKAYCDFLLMRAFNETGRSAPHSINEGQYFYNYLKNIKKKNN